LIELSMRMRGARHEILSANIANVDTRLSTARYQFRLDHEIQR
jgi:flagellar basal body rod protein FlgB